MSRSKKTICIMAIPPACLIITLRVICLEDVVASLYLIVPVALLFCALAITAWLWASRSGQFDDLDREARRILHDDPAQRPLSPTTDQDRESHDA